MHFIAKNILMLSANCRGNVNLAMLTFPPRHACYIGLEWFLYLVMYVGSYALCEEALTVSSINYRVSLVIFHKYRQNIVLHNHPKNMVTFRYSVLLLCLEFISGHPAHSSEFPFITYRYQSYYCL